MSRNVFSRSIVLSAITVALVLVVAKTIPFSHASSPSGVCALSI